MRIEYICHACLQIDTADMRLVTDPWYTGPAYAGQWHVFPKPIDTSELESARCILISHGHEDHLHPGTMARFSKDSQVFYPYNWYDSIKGFMGWMGFHNVQEAITLKTYAISRGTSVTYIANGLDSIIVIESGGKVLVDANDALHASHPNVIDLFVDSIRTRWPRIDTLFCGFGGASHFPNTIHVAGKDDVEIGRLREQLFVHNFCRIISGLRPRVAVPFAADFALLDDEKRWINDVRFPRERIPEYFREHFPEAAADVTVEVMYPRDLLEDNTLIARSPYRDLVGTDRFKELVDEQYSAEIAAHRAERRIFLEPASAEQLSGEIAQNVASRMDLYDDQTLADLAFCVRVTDVAENNCYNVHFSGGRPIVERGAKPAANADAVIDIRSCILRYSFESIWGGDAITIGYGCELHAKDTSTIERHLDSTCIRLLTRHPSARRHLKKRPIRALRHMLHSPLTVPSMFHRSKDSGGPDIVYDHRLWLLRTRCEVCQVCDMPLLDSEFGDSLGPVKEYH